MWVYTVTLLLLVPGIDVLNYIVVLTLIDINGFTRTDFNFLANNGVKVMVYRLDHTFTTFMNIIIVVDGWFACVVSE